MQPVHAVCGPIRARRVIASERHYILMSHVVERRRSGENFGENSLGPVVCGRIFSTQKPDIVV